MSWRCPTKWRNEKEAQPVATANGAKPPWLISDVKQKAAPTQQAPYEVPTDRIFVARSFHRDLYDPGPRQGLDSFAAIRAALF
jgi:hypothetical protein